MTINGRLSGTLFESRIVRNVNKVSHWLEKREIVDIEVRTIISIDMGYFE